MKFIAAAIQMLASEDKEANLKYAENAVREAAARGARVAALPEVFNWRGDKADEKKNSEPPGGPTAQRMARLPRAAGARGAGVAALPEVFNGRGDKADEKKTSEPPGGPTAERMARLARELKIYLLAGSFLEEIPEARKCYNTSLLFGPDGRQLARYRKIHLFDVAIARGVTALESETREYGAEVVTADTEFARLGFERGDKG